ncbi:MAG: energy-coupling factor transporter ATPase [Ruminococcaceae bacterium]|nr:energy-coupling factor transporter ATPase [Oscillospiraceae bacterium]
MSITIKNLTHIYSASSPFERVALSDVNLTIKDGDFVGLIGHTGSGKSTLIQHFNGLIMPNEGSVIVDGEDICQKGYNLKNVRKKVGIVFQYPEYQLFEETVYKDIAFGPKNMGMSDDEIDKTIHEVIKMVGLKEKHLEKSPFELSGGQKRRVAIAGVLAMNPKILVLDEPTAGLDPKGRDDILDTIKKIHEKKGTTVVLVTHSMEDIVKFAKTIIVMNDGKVLMHESTEKVFSDSDFLENIGLNVPQITQFANKLKEKGIDLGKNIFTVEDAKDAIIKYLREVKKC